MLSSVVQGVPKKCPCTTNKKCRCFRKQCYSVIQGVPKKCPGHIWYFNDNLIYAHLHRLPPRIFKTNIKNVANPRWGKRCKCARK